MRIRTLLLSSVVFGSVAMLSSASWAQTSPKMVYKPQGEWAVTRMASKGPGKDPYCTMARRFGDNVILTFARNAKDETSLAMDFQPDTLAKGQSYYVALDAGSNEKRAFDVTPVSDKAMVIRLGQDSKFHDALNRSGVLNVDVAGLQLEFDVPDMAKGHENLSSCVTALVEPASGQASRPAPKPEEMAAEPITRRASDDILAAPIRESRPEVIAAAPTPMPLEAPVMQVANNDEAESLREENMRLKNALARERREYEDRAMKENAGSSQVSEIMEKMKLLETENSELKSRVGNARGISAAPGTVVASEPDPKWIDEIAMLRRENESLKADMSAQKMAEPQIDPKLAAEVSKLREQNISLQSEIDIQKAAKAEIDPKVASEMAVLRDENAKLKTDIEAQRNAKPEVDPKLAAEMAQMRSDNDRLKTEIEAQKLAKAAVDPKTAQEIATLRTENDSMKAEISAKKEAGLEVDSKLASEISRLRDLNTKLQADIAAQKTAAALPDPKLTDEIATLRKENEGLKSEATTLKAASAVADPALTNEIAALRKENEALKTEMAAQKTAKVSADPKLANEMAMLRDENQSLRAEIAAQKTAKVSSDPTSSEEMAMLREENESLRSQIAMQKTAAADKSPNEAAVVARMQARIDELSAQNAKLQSELVTAQVAAPAAESAKSSEGVITVAQLRSIEQQLKAVETDRDRLRAQVEKAANGQEEGLIKLSGSDWNLEQSTRRFNEAEREVKRLGAQLEQSRAQCMTEKKEIEYMLFDPEIADKEQISKLMSLEEEVKRKDAEVSSLKAQLGGMSSPAMNSEAVRNNIASGSTRPQTRAAVTPVQVSSLEPAAGTPRVPVNAPIGGNNMMPFADEVQAEPIAAPAQKAAPATISSNSKLVTADALSSQLRQAGLALSGDVKKIDNVSGPAFVAYSWKASGLYGTAEQKPMGSPDQFQTLVSQYLDKTKSRCEGEFAASPVPTANVVGVSVASYEVACVGAEGAGATAALAFYGKDGLFTTVAHESSMDTMDTAMDARDRVIAGLASNKTTN